MTAVAHARTKSKLRMVYWDHGDMRIRKGKYECHRSINVPGRVFGSVQEVLCDPGMGVEMCGCAQEVLQGHRKHLWRTSLFSPIPFLLSRQVSGCWWVRDRARGYKEHLEKCHWMLKMRFIWLKQQPGNIEVAIMSPNFIPLEVIRPRFWTHFKNKS